MNVPCQILARVLLLAVLLCAPAAMAAEPDAEAARAAERALEAYTQGDWDAAILLFEEAIAHDPHPVLRFNRARALEEAKRLPSALRSYRELEEAPDAEVVAAAASARRQAIEAALLDQGYNPLTVTDESYSVRYAISIHTGTPHATVYVNGRAAGRGAQVLVRQPSGQHDLYIEAPGALPYQATLQVDDRDLELHVQLEDAPNVGAEVAPPPGLLTVVGPTAGMQIVVDGELRQRRTPANGLLVPSGEHEVLVLHPLYEDFYARVVIQPGEELRLTATNAFVGLDEPTQLIPRQRAGNALIGIGATVLAFAIVSGSYALVDSRRYNEHADDPNRGEYRDRAERLSNAADGSGVLGLVIAGTGLTMRLVRPKAHERDAGKREARERAIRYEEPLPELRVEE